LRSWNSPDLQAYLQGNRHSESETLTDDDLFNEQIMLGLRTAHGAILADSPERQSLLSRDLITPASEPSRFRLTASGLALADEIIRELIRI
jgi:coproporphyrinogen III oxidase-like Fe-S oxidoreductase